MGNDATEQTKCLAQIVHSHQWGKVILIYEDEPYGGDSGITTLLTEALQQIGSEIEYRLVLPPFASLANPKETVHQLLNQVNTHCNSRVFIVLDASWTLTRYLFEGAQEIGLAGNNSVWLMAEEIANLFPSFNNSAVEGGLGVKRYYSKSRTVFQDFEAQFWQKFSKEYPEEENYDAGYYSLLAYDGVRAIGKAIEGSSNNASSGFLESFLALDFQGLSGQIYFEENRIARKPTYRMVNVVNRELKELEFWNPGLGFSMRLGNESSVAVVGEVGLLSEATWPGNLTRILPKGWNMPTEKKKLRIGIPVSLTSKFLLLSETQEPQGFTIDLFQKVLAKLNYSLPVHFCLQNVSYDDLILLVNNKTLDAAIGDMTIVSNRTDYVDFTQPFAESGLSMILPVKSSATRGWTFMRPFKMKLWLLTLGILIYTAFIVWALEHRTNEEFQGTWAQQISTALWFTFNSLFFSQREDIKSNYTRVVVVVWLFIVLVLTQSYTADLASTLTIERLNQNSTDVVTLQRSNATIGCEQDSFIRGFLEDVLKFNQDSIINLNGQPEDILDHLKARKIEAAFVELPYAKLFHYKYCDGYSIIGPLYRFGGLGFAFQKGSPIAIDFSKAILTLTEDGTLQNLTVKWLTGKSKCAGHETYDSSNDDTGSLDSDSFWGLLVLSIATSGFCLVVSFLVPKIRKHLHDLKEFEEIMGGSDNGGQMMPDVVQQTQDDEHRGWFPISRSFMTQRIFPESPEIELHRSTSV
ncbi:Glutamate receptor 2.8-like protein [Drosera capensis]